ncbi:hypothetical protein GCM10010286_55310 [Streptomyces toxytricini]|nr:hypothetical protein GCM10010286_55310 [Streptomyces toxytricini]
MEPSRPAGRDRGVPDNFPRRGGFRTPRAGPRRRRARRAGAVLVGRCGRARAAAPAPRSPSPGAPHGNGVHRASRPRAPCRGPRGLPTLVGQSVRVTAAVARRKREPGAIPGLTRSGVWERKPSSALGSVRGTGSGGR